MPDAPNDYQPSVALVSEYPPPAAGMPVQAQQLLQRFQLESYPIVAIKTNPQFPLVLRWLEHIRGVRGFIKWIVFQDKVRVITGIISI